MEKRFQGRVALVTGATNGIGRETAVKLAAEGAIVGVNQRSSGDPGETLRRIREAGGEGIAVVADMSDPEAVAASYVTSATLLVDAGFIVNAEIRAPLQAPAVGCRASEYTACTRPLRYPMAKRRPIDE